MNNSFKILKLLMIFSLISGIASASLAQNSSPSQNKLIEQKKHYEIHKLKRVNNLIPIISGNLYDLKSKENLNQISMVVINKNIIWANFEGYYQQEILPGKHTIIARNVFYNNIEIKNISISEGDSIVINFYLTGQNTSN